MMLDEKKTFGDFLDSPEKIATNILTDRLKNLENGAFIFKHAVPGKARVGYSLTERGISLVPLVFEYIKWGMSQGFVGGDAASIQQISANAPKEIKKTIARLTQKLHEHNTPCSEVVSL